MILTVTESVLDAEQLAQVESLLAGFLPRMREAPGVARRREARFVADADIVWMLEANDSDRPEAIPSVAGR